MLVGPTPLVPERLAELRRRVRAGYYDDGDMAGAVARRILRCGEA